MSQRVAERLSTAYLRQFAGRAGERDLFRSALEAAEWPFQVLFVFGPGGIGTTTRLREFIRTRRNVPAGQLVAVLNFNYGHPLAIPPVADVCAQRPDTLRTFQPEAAPHGVGKHV